MRASSSSYATLRTATQGVAGPGEDPDRNKLTRGLGAGADPTSAARRQLGQGQIQKPLKGADMVFITAGMVGGTGTGAAPIVAEVGQGNSALVPDS